MEMKNCPFCEGEGEILEFDLLGFTTVNFCYPCNGSGKRLTLTDADKIMIDAESVVMDKFLISNMVM